jgi:O-antigen ligase
VLESVIRYAPNLLLMPILYSTIRTPRDIRTILLAFVAGALVSTAYGAFIAPGDADAAAEGRVTGAGTDPNYLATSIVCALVLCGGAVMTRRYSGGLRAAAGAGALLLMIALVATASRTGIIAFVVACLCAVALAGRGRRLPVLIMVGLALVLGAGYIGAVAPAAIRDRIQNVGGGGSGRTDIWKVGLRMAKANAVIGVGAGNFSTASVHYLLEPGALVRDDLIIDTPKVAHNIYLEQWAELGIVGALLFGAILAFALGCGIRAAAAFARAGDRAMELLSRSVVVGTIGMLAAAFFVSLQYDKPIWLMLSLGPCLLGLSRRAAPRG